MVRPFALVLAALLVACAARPVQETRPAERVLFDGRSLAGWQGDERFWSVEDGAIVGRSTALNPCRETTYLVWRGGEVRDFEIEFDYRIRGGNSGLQFRSHEPGPGRIAGYQADIEDGPSWSGCLYEQDGRGVLATRGERVRLGAGARAARRVQSAEELQALVRKGDWNHYVVRACGDGIELELNGQLMVAVVDEDARLRREEGLLALQLHAGEPMQVEFKDFHLRELPASARSTFAEVPALEAASAPAAYVAPRFEGAAPEWIWASAETPDHDLACFARAFELATEPRRATLRAAADNQLRVFVNGALALEHGQWWTHGEQDVTALVHAGHNQLALCARNEGSQAGAWVELVVEGQQGRRLRVISDASFSAERPPAERGFEHWTPADFDPARASAPHVFGAFGCAPWGELAAGMRGEVASRSAAPEESALDASALELAPGFRAELVYSVPKSSQGSWVTLCSDPRGRLYTSDQYGRLYRVTLAPPGGSSRAPQVEPLPVDIGRAQGLCWAYDALYVVVSEGGGLPTGLYRVRDSDGDDQLDHVELLRALEGGGEHGPHAVVLGPDGGLWIVAGNFTKLPELSSSRVPRTWAEDELLPHLADPNNHDPQIRAPGGWVCRTDADARTWELCASGLRNSYDIAFGPEGELFTFDSDMEWDVGAPWYRPTRILHLVSGADFGWRNGSAKWSATWPDTLPSVCDLGLSSPTGVAFGTGGRFPLRYQRALFACDWAYGTIYAVFLEARGASFGARHEVLARGKPFPVTDLIVGPDGALYVTTGGRGTQSGLYRIAWNGAEGDDPAQRALDAGLAEATSARAARRVHERAHAPDAAVDAAEIARAAHDLSDPDPFLRQAARVVGERADVAASVAAAADPRAPAALIARLHREGAACRADVLRILDELDLARCSPQELVDLLRVHQLVLLRCGPLPERARMGARLLPLLEQSSGEARAELARVLAALDLPATIDPLLDDLARAATQEDAIHLAHCLLAVKTGWSHAQHARYFEALAALHARAQGGASLVKFIERIQSDALAALPEDERRDFQPRAASAPSPSGAATPMVHAWTRAELTELLRARTPATVSGAGGAAAFEKARCSTCHRVAGAGGDTGPDLTGAGARFGTADLIEALLEPSKVISDQYRDVELVTRDGDLLVGRIEREDARTITLRRLPPQEDLIEVERADVEERRFHPLSRMPAGALDVLTADEVRALVDYVLATGNARR